MGVVLLRPTRAIRYQRRPRVITEERLDPVIAGPYYPSLAVNDNVDGGTAWTFPENLRTAIVSADVTVSTTTEVSQYLSATQFNFNIPLYRSVAGILVELVYAGTGDGPNVPLECRLIKNGVIRVSFRNSAPLNLTNQNYSVGGALDSWDEPWTPAEINSTLFGVALRKNVALNNQIYIDAVRMTVYTTDAVLPVATYSGFATFGPTSIPVDKTSITFYLDAVFHTVGSVTATLSVDVSYDGGSNWELFIKASGAGGTVAGPSGITEPRWYMRRLFPNPTDSNVRFRGALVVTGGSLLTSVGVFTN